MCSFLNNSNIGFLVITDLEGKDKVAVEMCNRVILL